MFEFVLGVIFGAFLMLLFLVLYWDGLLRKQGPDSSIHVEGVGYFDSFDDYAEYESELTAKEGRVERAAKRNLKSVIAYPCPEKHAGIGELCNLPGAWVRVERIDLANHVKADWVYSPYSYTREVDTKTSLYNYGEIGVWRAHSLSDCSAGCRIYENTVTLERVVAHNSTYGCNK